MNQKKRRDAGLPYIANTGVFLEQFNTRLKIRRYNKILPLNIISAKRKLKKLLGKMGRNVYFEPPFRCDYGHHIEIGDHFFANYGCIILDVAKVTIGDNCMFGPNVSILTAGHPIHHKSRGSRYEYGIPVKIGNNVWIGAGVIINPGVTIGDNVVIGSGSVVTKDVPSDTLAAGNPCRVLRQITDEDKKVYYKDRVFDKKTWAKIKKWSSKSN